MKRTQASRRPIIALVFSHNFKHGGLGRFDRHHTCDVYLDTSSDVRAHVLSSPTLSGLNDQLKERFGSIALPQFKGKGWDSIGEDRYLKIIEAP